MNKTHSTRSWFTTIAAGVVWQLVLVFTLLLIPVNGMGEVLFFGCGVLFVIASAVTAIAGKRKTLGELLNSLGW